MHDVACTDNTATCSFPPGKISKRSSSDNDALDKGNDRPNCFEMKVLPEGISTEAVSLGLANKASRSGYSNGKFDLFLR